MPDSCEESSNKLPRIKPSRKTGQPVLSVGSNRRRPGSFSSDITSKEEVLGGDQIKSRASLLRQVENKKEVGKRIHLLPNQFNLLVRWK